MGLAGRGVGTLRVTGSFRDEPVGVVLDAVARSLDLRLERRNGGYELSRKLRPRRTRSRE